MKAQHAPSGAQPRRFSATQVAAVPPQRSSGGTAQASNAATASVSTALPGVPNSARRGFTLFPLSPRARAGVRGS